MSEARDEEDGEQEGESMSVHWRVQCLSMEIQRDKFRGLGFYMITSCAKEFADSETSAKCLIPHSTNDNQPLYAYPVDIQGRVYRNVWCALCNGESVTEDNFWEAKIDGNCLPSLARFRKNFSDTGFYNHPTGFCHKLKMLFLPRVTPHHGQMRLGKLCLFEPLLPYSPLSPLSSSLSCSPAQHPTLGKAMIMMHDAFITIDADCLCAHCHPSVWRYVQHNMTKIYDCFIQRWMRYLTDRRLIIPGYLWKLFEADTYLEEGQTSEGENTATKVVTLTGTGTSIGFLIAIISHHIHFEGLQTRARRTQLGILSSKLLFSLSYCGATALRHVPLACKIFAICIHFSMMSSFCHMTWFSGQVAHMLWQLNKNMAALAAENRGGGGGRVIKEETGIILGIWSGALGLVVGLWCVEEFYDASALHYGLNEMCIISGKWGRLYFVVVPATIMVLTNFAALIFSLFQFVRLSDQPLDQAQILKLAKFLGKLIVFQSIQWIFGVIFYFSENSVVKFLFEISVAYEGTFMAISYFSNEVRRCCISKPA